MFKLLITTGKYIWVTLRFIFNTMQHIRLPLKSDSTKNRTAKTAPRAPSPNPLKIPRSLQPRAAPERALSGQGQWIPENKSIVVHGITIEGGLIYVGSTLKTPIGAEDPCLINPEQPIAFRSIPVRLDGYWPSYGHIDPQARRTYLEWLASGRKRPNIDIGYVFLYFYGLERRAIFDAALDSALMRDYPMLAVELTRLLGIYGNSSASFKKYAEQLLDWITFTHDPKLYASTNFAKIENSLMKIKFALGQASVDATPIPAKLIRAWIKQERHLFSIKTLAMRFGSQFDAIFETKYREQFGSGIVVKPNKEKLKFTYAPASSGFSDKTGISMRFKDIPDLTMAYSTIDSINAIIEDATRAIEPFSRYMSRNPQGATDLEGLVLLPSYLWPTLFRQKLHELKRAVLKAPMAMTYQELMATLSAGTPLKKDKFEALTQSLTGISIGIEPDFCLTSKVPRTDETIVLFDLPNLPDPGRDTTNYNTCLLTVKIASAVMKEDADFNKSAFNYLNPQLQFWTHLPANHRARLSAQLRILHARPIKLHTLSKQIQDLSQGAKNAIIACMATLVKSDRILTAYDVRFMQRVYVALGLDATHYLLDHQSILAADDKKKAAISKTQLHSTTTPTFVLDPLKIAALQSETSTVDALLQNIFTQQAIEDVQANAQNTLHDYTIESPEILRAQSANNEHNAQSVNNLNSILPGLDAAHSAFVECLLTREVWSRAELQDIASGMELMLDGALERLNDAAFDAHSMPFSEGEDPVEINQNIKELLPL